RTGSTRLPSKVLKPLGYGLLVDSVYERAAALGPPVLWVIPKSDVYLQWVIRERGWTWWGGSEEDVLERFVLAAQDFYIDDVVRVTADCPFLDVEAGRWTIQTHIDSGADLTLYEAEGRGVEVFRREALERALRDAPRSVKIFHEHP